MVTPWSRAFLEKLIVTELVKKFPSLYGPRKFITVFTRPAGVHYPEPDETNPHRVPLIKIRIIIIIIIIICFPPIYAEVSQVHLPFSVSD
jgi:hypothetical protein